jgi:hypothetical protein
MKPPPLPDIFGNYLLKGIEEVVVPAPIDWWPQTTGWLLLGLLLSGLALRAAWRRLRRWHRNRYRREALAQLSRLDPQRSRSALAAQLNNLLKRTALAAWPRPRVASLSGQPWAQFLLSSCPDLTLRPEQATLLAQSAYRPTALSPLEAQELLVAAAAWIEGHRGPADD